MQIRVKKGLDIPVTGGPEGERRGACSFSRVALDVSHLPRVRFSLKVREGDRVVVGQPLLEDKGCSGRMFVSPGCGVVTSIERGEKRRLLRVVISLVGAADGVELLPAKMEREHILARMMEGGAFARVIQRPCATLATPDHLPKSIFVQAVDFAPYAPPVDCTSDAFRRGIEALAAIAPVHIVTANGGLEVKGAVVHFVSGPFPASNPSIHIAHIDPIHQISDVRWTLHAEDVVYMGHLMEGRFHFERTIGIAGDGVAQERRGFTTVPEGAAIADLVGEIDRSDWALVSGDPLNGVRSDYLRMGDRVACVIAEAKGRQALHFCRLGLSRYTASYAYLSAFLPRKARHFTTNQHGEKRAFVDSEYYDKFMPLRIPTVPLIKAIMAKDYEMAVELGLLEVEPRDFAIAAFVCPSKIDMVGVVREGLLDFAEQYL